jgi:methionine-R-sulfoxide reductase
MGFDSDPVLIDQAQTRRSGRGGASLRLRLAVIMATGLIAVTVQVAAQHSNMNWRALLEKASQLTEGIMVDGKPYVRHASSYDPDQRIIHEEDADIAYPVQRSEEEWRERLGEKEYYVLREDGTEQAFENPLYDNKRTGIYYSAATGQPLFHSDDKYESGTGWPSFTKPISPDAVAYMWDRGLFSSRIEVIDSLSGSHLGHVFNDGPAPTGQRYCMNSAALIFVPEGGAPPELLTE